MLAYPTVEQHCLAVCDIDILAAQVERPPQDEDCAPAGKSSSERGGEQGGDG